MKTNFSLIRFYLITTQLIDSLNIDYKGNNYTYMISGRGTHI